MKPLIFRDFPWARPATFRPMIHIHPSHGSLRQPLQQTALLSDRKDLSATMEHSEQASTELSQEASADKPYGANVSPEVFQVFLENPSVAKSPEAFAKMPYIISRTNSRRLPVYRSRQNGTELITTIRKVYGDLPRFANEITSALNLDRAKARVNEPARSVQLQGDWLNKTKQWLEMKGF